MAKKYVNGILVDLTAEDITAEEAKEKAWSEGTFDRKIAHLRKERNRLLTETDFYALSDVTISAEMTTYRQELRDLTSWLTTVEEVNNVTFPTKP